MPFFGQNAAAFIARAAPIGPITDLAEISRGTSSAMRLPEPVTLVRASGDRVFHLAEKRGFRGDTSTYPWLFWAACATISAPSHYLAGNQPNTHRLIGAVTSSPSHHPPVRFISVVLKFVPSNSPRGSGFPELWLSTIEPHSEKHATPYLRRAVAVAA